MSIVLIETEHEPIVQTETAGGFGGNRPPIKTALEMGDFDPDYTAESVERYLKRFSRPETTSQQIDPAPAAVATLPQPQERFVAQLWDRVSYPAVNIGIIAGGYTLVELINRFIFGR